MWDEQSSLEQEYWIGNGVEDHKGSKLDNDGSTYQLKSANQINA